MTDDAAQADLRGPVIDRDEHSATFFDAARSEQLVIRRCGSCSRSLPPQAQTCDACGGAGLEWIPTRGDARLVTWTVVHRPPHAAFVDQVPYVSGYVRLSEGPWLPARIVGADPEELHGGMSMRVAFVHPAQGESYPVFTPDRAAWPARLARP